MIRWYFGAVESDVKLANLKIGPEQATEQWFHPERRSTTAGEGCNDS